MLTLLIISILLGEVAHYHISSRQVRHCVTINIENIGAKRYVGCFEDSSNTDVPGVTVSDKNLKKCVDFCMSENYRSCVNRNGCYCGESFGRGPLPEGRCYAYCPELPAEECVGKYTNSVWYTGEKDGSNSAYSGRSEDDNIGSRQSRDIADAFDPVYLEETIYYGQFSFDHQFYTVG